MSGTLFVVATPIGNLEDLTFRALRTLKEVDAIAAEDTRRTSKLLAHYGVSKPLVSLHEHNEHREAPKLVGRMVSGQSLALVSDAGTPGISDPGTTLVRLAREAGVRVVPIPGPSAVTAALSVSGLPATPFTFLGFPPPSGQARERWLEQLHQQTGALVFFEAPHRIVATMDEAKLYLSERPIMCLREATKINEELVLWTNINGYSAREQGEFVIVVGPGADPKPIEHTPESVHSLFDQLITGAGLSHSHAMTALSSLTGMSQRKLASLVKKGKILAKRQSVGPS